MSLGSSRRWILAPTMVVTAMASAPPDRCRALARLGPGPIHGFGGGLHRLDDVHVARAPAEVAFQALADLVLRRVRVLLQEVGRGHDETGRAVAALQTVLVPERLLERVELPIFGHALNRGQLLALGLDGEHRAALDRLAVDEDRARAALARVAPDVGAGQPDDVPQVMHQQKPRFDLMLVPVAVDRGRDLVLHMLLLITPGGGGARDRAGRPGELKANPYIALLLAAKCN